MTERTINGGLVIMLDGPDGVGKTTQLRLAKTTLEAQGYRVHQTRVSGGTAIGEALRQVSLSKTERPPETDMYIALAMYHALAQEIAAHRGRGDICLVDRSPLAIIGYQVYGSGLDEQRGKAASDEAYALLHPELVVVYTAPLDVLANRRQLRHESADYFEQKPAAFAQAVIKGYEAASRYYPVKTIEASEDIQTVHKATMGYITGLL